MSTATVEQLKESFESGDPTLSATVRQHFLAGSPKWDEKRVLQALEAQREQLLNHRLGKTVRPWDLVNMSQKLDPKQPWVGLEFETGYANNEAYQKIVNYVWNNFPLSTIDHEGCGAYPCEITFAPVNFDDFVANDNYMDKLLKYMRLNACPKSAHNAQVGTHCNISTPSFRQLSKVHLGKTEADYHQVPKQIGYIVSILNNSIGYLKSVERRKFFGRQPYGGFYSRGNKYGAWIEGKLFDSTGDLKKWRGYKEVIAKLCEVIEYLSKRALKGEMEKLYKDVSTGKVSNAPPDYARFEMRRIQDQHVAYISNLAEIIEGKVPVNKATFGYAAPRNNYW